MHRLPLLAILLLAALAVASPAAAQSCSGNYFVRIFTEPEGGEVRPGQVIQAQAVVFNAYGQQVRCEVRWSVSGPGQLLDRSMNYAQVRVRSGPGRITLRASTFGGRQDDSRTFVVTETPLVLEIQPDSVVLQPGEQKLLELILVDEQGGEFVAQGAQWQSENPAVARVEANGTVVAVAPGETRIRGSYRPPDASEPRHAESVVRVVPRKE